MAKQLNVDLHFNADTSGAKKAIADLQASLNNLMQFNQSPAFKITDEIAAANVEVGKLQVALQSALNPKTGTLDLARLQQSLQQAGSSISQVEAAFNNMGAAGQVAFQQFAATIAQAQVPTMRLSGLMGEMWTTLKNVARFQISSSIIHGLVGGIQSAVTYAQNLNESLNNIRIVTGDSSDRMAQFAREANIAAKELNTTTLDYTRASLIYYQQGLNDQQVKERTDVTVKLANVSRQSAQAVSDQMTAIWENFDNGSQSLEYFADVITALGATTASSSQEIAKGLEKFAPVAGTIGLSYETATAALATIVANTRQSADTVGTGLRTIFSRFESLKLGETLEDGVDLSKYTKALKTVGVEVLDVNGKLKDADTIIFDLADKWKLLDNTQKTALATTVGGVRQYSTLMALFNNWDDMLVNLNTARGSEGTLQGQADIYAESWEAARNRVQTALQGLYDTLINDDAFIGMLNGIENVVSGIDNFIQSLGGAKVAITGIAATILTFANAGVSNAITNMAYNLRSLTGIGEKQAEATKQGIIERALGQQTKGSDVQNAQSQAMKNQISLQQTLNQYGKQYNDLQRQIAQTMIQNQRSYDEQVISSQQELDNINRRIQASERLRDETTSARERERIEAHITDLKIQQAEAADQAESAQENSKTNLKQVQDSLKNLSTSTMTGADMFAGLASGITSATFGITALVNGFKTLGDESSTTGQKIQTMLLNIPMGLTMITNSWKNGFGKIWNGLKGNAFNQNMQNVIAPLFGPNVSFAGAYKGKNATQIVNKAAGYLSQNQNLSKTSEKELASLTALLGIDKARTAEIANQVRLEASKAGLTEEETAALLKQKLAQEGTTAAALKQLAIYAAIVAAILAVVAALYLMYQAYNADAIAAGRAAKAQQALQQKSQEAQQNLTNIKEAFQGYDDAVKALNDCTKGTQEWNDALKAVNDEVLEIMENNPELAKQMQTHRDANGMLVIDNKDQLLTEAQSRADNARYAAIMGAVSASQAQLASDRTDFRRQHTWSEVDENGNISQAAVEHNAVITEALSNLGSYAGMTVTEIAKEFSDKLPATELESFAQGIYDLANATSQVANQMENAANAIAEAKLGDEYGNAESEIASEYYEAEYKNIYDQIMQRGRQGVNIWSGRGNENVQDIWRRYSAATGTNYALASNAVTGTDTNRSFQYLDQGETKQISLEEMAAAIAASEALTSLGVSAAQAQQSLSKLDKTSGEAKNISNFVANGNLGSATAREIENLSQIIGDQEGKTIQEKAENYLKKTFGEDTFNKMGGSAWAESLVESLQIDFANIGKELSYSAHETFSRLDKEDLSADGQRALANTLDNVLVTAGQQGLEQFENVYNQFKGDPEKLNAFLTAFNGIDWSTAGPDALKMALIAGGFSATEMEGAILGLNAAMLAGAAAAQGLEAATSKYKKIHDIIDSLDTGSTLEKDKYDELVNMGEGVADYFTMLADGTYMFTGNVEEFYNKMNELSLQGFEENIRQAEENNATVARLNEQYGGSDFSAITANNNNGQSFQDYLNQFNISPGASGESINRFINARQEEWNQQQGTYNKTYVQDQLALLQSQGIDTSRWDAEIEHLTNADLSEIQSQVEQITEGFDSWDDLIKATEMAGEQLAADQEKAVFYSNLLHEINAAGLDYKEVSDYADELQRLDETFANNREGALEFAVTQMKVTKGIEQISKSLKTYQSELKKGATQSKEYTSALKEIKKGLSNILGVDIDKVFGDQADAFVEAANDAGLLTDVMNDVPGAIDKVYQFAGDRNLAEQMGIKPEDIAALKPEELHNYLMQNLTGAFEGLGSELQTIYDGLPKFKAGDLIDDANITSALDTVVNGMLDAGQSIGNIMDFLATQGVEAEFVPHVGEGVGQFKGTASGVNMIEGPNGSLQPEVYDAGEFGTDVSDEVVTYDLVYHKKGGGGGGGNKGGGGGGGKQKKKDTPKPDRSARYHEVNRKQNANKRRQSAAQNTADRTVGRVREKQLERQIKLEKESLELSKRKLKEAQDYVEVDRKALEQAMKAAKVSLKKFPIEIDEDGSIKNYEEIMNEIFKKEQELVKKYNAGKIDDEKYEEEKKKLDELKEAMDNYEESLDAAQEAAEAMVQSINNILDLQLKKITYDVEFQIQLNDSDIKLLEHLFDKVDDDVYSTAAAIGILGREMQVLLDSAEKYRSQWPLMREEMYRQAEEWRNRSIEDDELQALLANYGFYEKAIAQLKEKFGDAWDEMSSEKRQEKIREAAYAMWQSLSPEELINYLNGAGYTDSLQELQDNILELDSQIDEVIDKINEKVINAFNELYDKEQEQIEVFDHYTTIFDNLTNIADLTRSAIGSANARALQNMLRDSSINNQGNRLTSSYALYQQMMAKRQEYEKKLREATTEEERKLYEDLVKEAQDKERETLEQWQEDLTGVLESIREKAEAIIEDITNDFRNAFSDVFANEDYFNAVYDRAKDIEDSYVSDYEKLYRMSELEHQSNKLLDNLDNPKYRKEVLAFQERVNEYKKAGIKLSQNQIDAEQKWLDLIQARIALEDARNAKQTVRLQRDNEGNWGYVYTNDADDIADAEAQAQKALYEYQKSLDDSNNEILERVREFRSGLADDMEQLSQQLMDGLITEEQYNAEMQRLQDLATQQEKIFASQSDWLYEHLHDTYNEMLELYSVDAAELPDTFGKTSFAKLLGYDSIDDALENIIPGIQKVQTETIAAWTDMNKKQDEMLAKTGMTLETLTSDVNAWATAVTTASGQNVIAVQQIADSFDNVMQHSIEAVEREWSKWLNDLKETRDMLMDIAREIGLFNRDIFYAGDDTGNNPVDIPTNEDMEQASENPNIDSSGTLATVKSQNATLNEIPSKLNDMLQEQIGLNIANMLNVSSEDYNDFINTIMEYLKMQAQTASYGFGNLMSGTYTNDTGDTIQQEVHIDANFPNVTNSSEIEEAFENLVNKAAQFANRKRQG